MFRNATSLFAVKDAAGRYEFANTRFLSFFGLTLEAVRGRTDYQLFDNALSDRLREGDFEVLRRRVAVDRDETVTRGERVSYLRVTRFPLMDADGNVSAVCTQAADISEQRAAQEALRLAANVFDFAGEGICVPDARGLLVSVNDSFTRITGYTRDEVMGGECSMLKSGRHPPDFYQAMWSELTERGKWQGEIWNRRKDGTLIPEWLTISAVRDEQGAVSNYVGIFSDISAIKASHERIEHLATHDELTGLPNRNLFNDRVKHAIARAAHRGELLFVLFVDLDNFKVINDNLGHAAGDDLLREAAVRIGECLRPEDTVARLGGDEFILLIEGADPELISALGKRILDFLSASYRVQGRDVFVTASVGISSFPDDGQDSETLLKNADTAMYKAKERGKNQFQFFSVEMKLHGEQRMAIETGIRLALQEDQFSLMFQPEVELASGRILSAEALIRWTAGPLGEVSPARFIPVAEQSGLIVKVTDWVVRRVCESLRGWLDAGRLPVPVFVNISPLHFRTADLVASLTNEAARCGVSPHLIGIEITEGALMDGSEGTIAVLHALRALGVRVYVDDFGTGYSSLTYLKRYPIDGLKIDRSFVDGIADDPDDQAIATAVIGVARALGVDVVAEGVETEEQRAELIARGCTLAQGYLMYRPMAAEAFGALLVSRDGASTRS